MTDAQKNTIEQAVKSNPALARAYNIHQKLNSQVDSFKKRAFLSEEEEAQLRKLKREKLFNKENLLQMIKMQSGTA